MGAAGTKERRGVPQFTQNVFVAAFTVPQAGHAIEADKRYPRRASRRELVEPCGGLAPRGHGISRENRARSLSRIARILPPLPWTPCTSNIWGSVSLGRGSAGFSRFTRASATC